MLAFLLSRSSSHLFRSRCCCADLLALSVRSSVEGMGSKGSADRRGVSGCCVRSGVVTDVVSS